MALVWATRLEVSVVSGYFSHWRVVPTGIFDEQNWASPSGRSPQGRIKAQARSHLFRSLLLRLLQNVQNAAALKRGRLS